LEKPKKIIIDCDAGCDDASAILLAIHLCKIHNAEILGITTTGGNTEDH
jgi:inosine-uridine nucleoside N-ribohydrolase